MCEAFYTGQVGRKFTWSLWLNTRFEIRPGGDDGLLEVRTDAHRDRILRHLLAKANVCVEAIGEDVSEPIAVDDFNR